MKSKSKSKSIRHEKGDQERDGDGDGDGDEDEGDENDSASGEGGGWEADSKNVFEDTSEDEDLTGHAAHSKRMKGKIDSQERELMAEKPWSLRGEVKSSDRPENRWLRMY